MFFKLAAYTKSSSRQATEMLVGPQLELQSGALAAILAWLPN